MAMSRVATAAVVAVLFSVTACTGTSDSGNDKPSTTAPSPPAVTSGASSPTVTAPATDCLSGRYRLARFVAVGDNSTYGTGEGGDVAVDFDDPNYTLTGAGKDPVTLTLAGQQGRLTVDGTIDGSYSVDGSKVTFTAKDAQGSARLTAGGQSSTLTMDEVSKLMAPKGTAVAACANAKVALAFESIRLELERP